MRFSLTDVFPLPFWVQQQTDGWIPTRFSPRQTRLSSLVQPTVFRSPQHLVSFAVCSMLEAERRIPYFRYRRHARSVICASCQQGVSMPTHSSRNARPSETSPFIARMYSSREPMGRNRPKRLPFVLRKATTKRQQPQRHTTSTLLLICGARTHLLALRPQKRSARFTENGCWAVQGLALPAKPRHIFKRNLMLRSLTSTSTTVCTRIPAHCTLPSISFTARGTKLQDGWRPSEAVLHDCPKQQATAPCSRPAPRMYGSKAGSSQKPQLRKARPCRRNGFR